MGLAKTLLISHFNMLLSPKEALPSELDGGVGWEILIVTLFGWGGGGGGGYFLKKVSPKIGGEGGGGGVGGLFALNVSLLMELFFN